MDPAIVIRLAGVPVGKGRPRFVRSTGRAFTPAATRSYESALRLAAQEAMGDRAPLDGALHVHVAAHFPVPASWPKKRQRAALDGELLPATKPDVDNLLKVLDALNEVVWRDDKQIVSAVIWKRYSDAPGLFIKVEPL